ncbi:MAG: hypothetical protein ACOX6I_07615 [Syntrophomonadaceae bacterium]|jgi:hypothetical protein
MKIYVAMDDLRQLDGGKAGATCSSLARAIEDKGWGICSLPSRHRLYPSPETNCKKHNTARSFSADIKKENLTELIDYACSMIREIVTPDSNTGLVIAVPEQMENIDELIEYAYKAKEELVSKSEALEWGHKPGMFLFELNGSGRGIIGALAAAGLNMTGNDGQFRGKLKLSNEEYYIATVKEIIEKTYVEQVKNMDFEIIGEDDTVRMGEKVKVVKLDHKYTLLVFPTEVDYPKWQTTTTNMLRIF